MDKGNSRKVLVIKFRIHQGYNIYAFVSEKDPFIVTEVKTNLPEGYEKSGELKEPSFSYYNDSGTTKYTDEVMFLQEIKGSSEGTATCTVTYQCCDAHICFPPVYDKAIIVKLN